MEERAEEYTTKKRAKKAKKYYEMMGCSAVVRIYKDETEYLLSSENNKRRLMESRRQIEEGTLEKIPTEDLVRELKRRESGPFNEIKTSISVDMSEVLEEIKKMREKLEEAIRPPVDLDYLYKPLKPMDTFPRINSIEKAETTVSWEKCEGQGGGDFGYKERSDEEKR